jgi:hypothetical protein
MRRVLWFALAFIVISTITLMLKGWNQYRQTPHKLTPQDRMTFIDSTIKTCKPTMRAKSDPTVTDALIQSFCECYAQKLADAVTEQDVLEQLRDRSKQTPTMYIQASAARGACHKQLGTKER